MPSAPSVSYAFWAKVPPMGGGGLQGGPNHLADLPWRWDSGVSIAQNLCHKPPQGVPIPPRPFNGQGDLAVSAARALCLTHKNPPRGVRIALLPLRNWGTRVYLPVRGCHTMPNPHMACVSPHGHSMAWVIRSYPLLGDCVAPPRGAAVPHAPSKVWGTWEYVPRRCCVTPATNLH